jgi:hypothetical protein
VVTKQDQQRREIFGGQACVLKQADRLVLCLANGGVYAGRLDVSKVHQHAVVRVIRELVRAAEQYGELLLAVSLGAPTPLTGSV